MTTAAPLDIASKDIVCSNGMPAVVAVPKAGGPYPAVILMHERYGLVQHTRDQAVRCARDGYAVIAPNFFFKHPDPKVLNAGDSRYDLTDPESVELMNGAIGALAEVPAADVKRLAICGYCQTGRHPLVYAAQAPISAAVVWYGAASEREWPVNKIQSRPLEEIIGALTCPTFAAFGEKDHIISIPDVIRFRNAFEAKGKSYEIHIYKDAPHGWLNDTMPGRYRKEQAEAGWAAQQRFLARVLEPGYDASITRWEFTCESGSDYDFSKNVRLE